MQIDNIYTLLILVNSIAAISFVIERSDLYSAHGALGWIIACVLMFALTHAK